jgi:hypothetical protein
MLLQNCLRGPNWHERRSQECNSYEGRAVLEEERTSTIAALHLPPPRNAANYDTEWRTKNAISDI